MGNFDRGELGNIFPVGKSCSLNRGRKKTAEDLCVACVFSGCMFLTTRILRSRYYGVRSTPE